MGALAIGLCIFAASRLGAEESMVPADVVDAFSAAIDRGDRVAALSLLERDVAVFENGFADRSRSEFEGQHLAFDISFASTTERTLRSRRQGGAGDLYWITSLYEDRGTFEGKPVHLSTAETVLLRRSGGRWRISHLHWSADQIPPEGSKLN